MTLKDEISKRTSLEHQILEMKQSPHRTDLARMLIRQSEVIIQLSILQNDKQDAASAAYGVVETLGRVGETEILKDYIETFDEGLPKSIVFTVVLCARKFVGCESAVRGLLDRFELALDPLSEGRDLLIEHLRSSLDDYV